MGHRGPRPRPGRLRGRLLRARRRAVLAFLLGPVAAASLASCGPRAEPAVRDLPLNQGWRLRPAEDSSAWLPATVPGTVHTDILAAGRIPDPLRGDHEAELAWIEDGTWVYRREMDVDAALLREERVELVFEGLDTWAVVRLNGEVVLEAANMFRTWRVDVRDRLREGSNTLTVRFPSQVARGAARAAAHPWPIPHQEPDAKGTRAFSRKAAYHFGWDWGPRYVTAGIWRPVRLEAWSGARIAGARVASVTWLGEGRDSARVRLAVSYQVAAGPMGTPVRIGVRSPDLGFEPVVEEVPAPAPGTLASWQVDVTVRGAEPWWPRGMGRPPGRLYGLEVDAVLGDRWDRHATRVGLRTVELVTEADTVGESFFFRVNGEPVFARGANVVPPDHFTHRADSATYARLVDDAVSANMNMLRVWGGGVYLPDVFYDLADEAGLMVWQDFMFANTLVPGDSAYVASVAAEAEDQVRRLRRHPSLALWCGNNEVAEGWANWGWRDDYTPEVAAQVEAAYRRIFEDVLPAAVARLHAGAAYVPSSPRLGWGRPESLTEGDAHYWGVWWGMEPFRAYAEKVPRFASEFGFQALPHPTTLAAFADDGAAPPAGLGDPVLRAHQKHPTGYETIRTYLEREWPVPPDDSLDAWSHVSQLAQATGVGLALEAHRRAWPRTGGTLYWQLNDTWPVVSWSSVDVLGRWKALHHEARRVFAPVAVLADRWADTVAVWVASDTAVTGTLVVRVVDFGGRELARRAAGVRVLAPTDPPMLPATAAPSPAWRGTVASLLPRGADARRVVVITELRAEGGASGRVSAETSPAGRAPTEDVSAETSGARRAPLPLLARDHAFLVPPKDLLLPDPGVRVVSALESGGGWDVALTVDGLAYGLRVDVEGADVRLSDDFVHVVPGDTLRLRVETPRPVPDLPARLRFRSLTTRR